MKFWEAMKALDEGKKVRPIDVYKGYLYKKNNKVYYSEFDDGNQVNELRINLQLHLDYNWEIVQDFYSTSIEELYKIAHNTIYKAFIDALVNFYNEVGEVNKNLFMKIIITTKENPQRMTKKDIFLLINKKYNEYKKMIGVE